MKVKRDQITGIILALAGVGIIFMTGRLKAEMSFSYPGAKFLPLFSAAGMILCGIGIVIESMVSKKQEQKFMDLDGVKRAVSAFVVLAAYIFLMNYLGFCITTPFMLFAFCTLFAGQQKLTVRSRIIYSVLCTMVVYIVYSKFFGVHLPQITF